MYVAIVEDEKTLADSIREGLEMEGHAADVFYDGERALTRLKKDGGAYDTVILDLALPRTDGFEITQKLREKGITVPILVLTARDSVEDKVRALDSGADDFLTKPFAFDELLARVRALLRRPREATPAILRALDLALDPAARSVTRAGETIALTLKEFELLYFLMRYRGQVKTRPEIVRHLWGLSDEELGNVVDVHIRNLRGKIDDNHDEKIIRTVRGVGYAIL